MKLKIILLTSLLIFIGTAAVAGQDDPNPVPSPSPSPTVAPTPDPDAEIENETKRLENLKKLEKARIDLEDQRRKAIADKISDIKGALPTVSQGGPGNSSSGPESNVDSIALSYAALEELSGEISKEMTKPGLPVYDRYIVYNAIDFDLLSRYRFFRSQSKTVITRYNALIKLVNDANRDHNSGLLLPSLEPSRGASGGLDMLLTGLNIPSFVTPVVKSVGELINTIRPTVTDVSAETPMSDSSFVAAIATALQTKNSKLKFYYPGAFVPDYEWDEKKPESVLALMSKMYVIKTGLADFQAQYTNLSEEDKKKIPEISKLIPTLGIVKKQAEPLCPDAAGNENTSRGGQNTETAGVIKFAVNDLIRGEKIDEMIKGDQNSLTGILQVKVLKAGGTKRTSSSLILGNKIRYSGSVIVEVFLFDNDGTLKLSKTFFHHTGFRKL